LGFIRGFIGKFKLGHYQPEPVLTLFLFLFQGSMTAIYLRDPGGNLVEVASYG